MVFDKNKVYTHVIICDSTITTGGTITDPSVGIWLLQDDINVIGWHISTELLYDMNVDGTVHANVEVSQAPWQNKDGVIGALQTVGHVKFTTALLAGGIGAMSDNIETMLPSGLFIKGVEGEYINVHSQIESPGGQTAALYPWVFIYYTKRP